MLGCEIVGDLLLSRRRFGQFFDRQSRQNGARVRFENIFGGCVLIALLDQQPVLFVLRPGTGAHPRAHERERTVEFEAVQLDVDFSLANRIGRIARRIDNFVDTAIPHDDGTRAVVAGRNHALEVAVLERMVFDGDCKMLVGRIHRGAFRNGPRAQDTFHLESKVVVKPPRRVLLYDEGAAVRGTWTRNLAPERFRRARRAAFATVLSDRHSSLPMRKGESPPLPYTEETEYLAGAAAARGSARSLGDFALFGLGGRRGFFAILFVDADAALFQRFLQRAHQIDHLALPRFRGGLGQLMARHLLLGRLYHPFAIVVLELARLELLLRQIVEQALRESQFGVLHSSVSAVINLAERSNLIIIIHRVEHQAAIVGTYQDQPLLAAHRVFRDSYPLRLGHRFLQQMVGLGGCRLASEQIGILEIDGIDFGRGNELGNFDRTIGLRFELFQFLIGEGDVAIFLDFVAAHQLAAIDDLVFLGTIDLLLNATHIRRVQKMEADGFGTGRGEQSDRDGHKSKCEAGGGYRASRHDLKPPKRS